MRLIDADALKKIMAETLENIMCFPQMSGEERHIICAFDTVGQMIDDATTIDAVPVVRCKDCKYYLEFRTKRNKQLMRWCYRLGKHDQEYRVNPDDFCSYGEQRDEMPLPEPPKEE